MLELVLNIVGFALLALAVWVFIDARRNKIEKGLKWAFLMLINPFALKKYLKIRHENLSV